MSEVIAWGGAVQWWRCGVAASVAEVDESWCDVTVTSVWQSMGYGFQVNYCSAYVSCDGVSGGTAGTVYAYSPNGTWTQLDAYSQTFRVARGTYARSVAVSASFVMPDFQAGSSYASATVEVPGKPAVAPDPVSSVAAAASGSAVRCTWANNADAAALKPYNGLRVAVEVDGSVSETAELDASATSYEVAAASNRRYAFTVTAWNSAGEAAGVASGYVYTAPSAPSAVTAAFVSPNVSVSWSAQARWAASHTVQESTDGGSTWSTLGDASGSTFTRESPPSGTVRYRVQAVAPDGTAGPFAESGDLTTYTTADYPALEVTVAEALHDIPLYVEWTVDSPTAVESQKVQLVVGGEVVQEWALAASQRAASLYTSELVDGEAATVRVTATNAAGLTSTAEATTAVEWWAPMEPTARVLALSGFGALAVSVSPNAPDDSHAETFDVRVERGGRAAVELSTNMFYDFEAPINLETTYTAVAVAHNGLETSVEVSGVLEAQYGFFSYAFLSVPIIFDQSWDTSVKQGGGMLSFAGGGLPEWYPDGSVTQTVTAKFNLAVEMYEGSDLTDPEMLSILAMAPRVYLRDPAGGVFGGVVTKVSTSQKGPRVLSVTVALSATPEDPDTALGM